MLEGESGLKGEVWVEKEEKYKMSGGWVLGDRRAFLIRKHVRQRENKYALGKTGFERMHGFFKGKLSG